MTNFQLYMLIAVMYLIRHSTVNIALACSVLWTLAAIASKVWGF